MCYRLEVALVGAASAAFLASCAHVPASAVAVAETQIRAEHNDPRLTALLRRYIDWRGGAAYRQLRTVKIEQDAEFLGLNGTYVQILERDGTSFSALDLGRVQQRIWTDLPSTAWEQTNGVVRDRAPDSARDTQRMTLVALGEALLGGGGATVSLLPDESREGRTWSIVRIGFGDPDTYDLFIDPETGALHGYRVTRNRRTRFTTLGDWRLVDGVRFPFVEEGRQEQSGDTSRVRVRSLMVNAPLDPALATRPEGRRIVQFTDGSGSTGPIPFNYVNGNRVYIPARVNGRVVEVILDSGADTTVLDRAFAREIGLETFGGAAASGAGGYTESSFASDVLIEMGNLRLDHPQVAVLDLSAIARGIGVPMPVILGRPAFDNLIVDIDFERRTIAFHDPARFQAPPSARTIPLNQVGGNRSVPVSIEGGPPVEVQFDLGNSGNFEVFPVYWQERRMLEGRRTSTRISSGVGGEAEEIAGTVESIDFAGVRFTDVPSSFIRRGSGHDDDRFSGIVGIPILSRFQLMIDYAGDRLHLIPHADVQSRPFPKNRTGLSLATRPQGMEVTRIWPGSPAEAAGWRVGDMVAAIDGVAVGAASDRARRPQLELLPAGQRVTFRMRDGSSRSLVLADYF